MPHDFALLFRAASFAAQAHSGQRRKDADQSPYINHPLAVAQLLTEVGGVQDLELLIAALLHDTVEDTEVSLEEIAERFGERVRDLVAEVTDDKSLPKQQRKRLQVEHAPQLSAGAKQLKIADKISNLRDLSSTSPAGWSLERKRQYVDWGEQVVAGCRGINVALEQQFDQTVQEVRQRLATDASRGDGA
ncbi:HD domain-containing protein [Candidatus Laterigemmans baculatus]|uniref:HD domain-containing protein n=1 Tax=Candidatus Laterigemmans baculatus TaxID=2770505 RepID=UPI0013D9D5BA|nr:HD domain-containing protein [Candidatus Laterigemmans baculatus]